MTLAWFLQRVSLKDPNLDELHIFGCCYEAGAYGFPDLCQASNYFKLAADRGHPGALYDLGRCFAEGKGFHLYVFFLTA